MLSSKLLQATPSVTEPLFFHSSSIGSSLGHGGVAASSTRIAYTSSVTNSVYSTVIDYNGDLQLNKVITHGSGLHSSSSVAIDSSGNLYFLVRRSTPSRVLLVKLSSEGALVWCRQLSHATLNLTIPSARRILITDGSDIYIALYVTGGSFGITAIFKYNSSGVLQWQKQVSGATYNALPVSLDITPDNYLMFGVYDSSLSRNVFVYKVSTSDGSVSNSYGLRAAESTGSGPTGILSSSSGDIFVGGWVVSSLGYQGVTKYSSTFTGAVSYASSLGGSIESMCLVDNQPVLSKSADAYIVASANITTGFERSTSTSVTHTPLQVINGNNFIVLFGTARTSGAYNDVFVSKIDHNNDLDLGTYGSSEFIITSPSHTWDNLSGVTTTTITSTYATSTFTEGSDTVSVAEAGQTVQLFLKD